MILYSFFMATIRIGLQRLLSGSSNIMVLMMLGYSKDKILVDVRGPEEYSGKILAPPEYASEQPQRGGHIPGAINIPWDWAVNEDGTFKSADELEKIYASMDVAHNKEVITYCRIGERSAYTWFVLKYLLGYPNVKNYEGSWAEWGSTVGNPIEK